MIFSQKEENSPRDVHGKEKFMGEQSIQKGKGKKKGGRGSLANREKKGEEPRRKDVKHSHTPGIKKKVSNPISPLKKKRKKK